MSVPDPLVRRSRRASANNDTITVTLDRRAYSPVLRQSDLPTNTTVPWWQGHQLRLQFA
ncbi:MAG: hypothetical protein ACRDRX_28040 [Pseudonocardiaceae bacterium]